jgi:MoaA/NifB/PqqE/SkfB family radical SAM enzyme
MGMSGPEEIIWIITGACNLNCPYCYAKQYADEEEISGDAVLELLEEASNEGVNEVNFTGGEPLLRKDIFRILRKTVDLGMNASLFTNLMKMDRDNAVELCKLDIYVLTSLDGPRTVYERAKGFRILGQVHKRSRAPQGTWSSVSYKYTYIKNKLQCSRGSSENC